MRFQNVAPRSSVDNLLRTTQQHLVQLSFMADTKASILITISSIVLTIALSRSSDPYFRRSVLTLAAACLMSLVLAVLAILPTFTLPRRGRRGRAAVANILFFGHFGGMSEDEYMDAMETVLASDPVLYETAVRDIYSLGVYLYRKKYRFLRLAYIALLSGFILSSGIQAWTILQ